MAATDPITDANEAQAALEDATAWQDDPALTADQVTRLVAMAASDDGDGGTQYTIADLNRVASLGWQWKLAAAVKEIKVGVGPGKTFELQLIFDHCEKMAAWYANGTLSVVGSADASDGTAQGGSSIGSVTLQSVMTS